MRSLVAIIGSVTRTIPTVLLLILSLHEVFACHSSISDTRWSLASIQSGLGEVVSSDDFVLGRRLPQLNMGGRCSGGSFGNGLLSFPLH